MQSNNKWEMKHVRTLVMKQLIKKFEEHVR